MIISHKHQFIFIKPQKTAGTSVELLLSQICGHKDILTPFGFDPDKAVRESNKMVAQNFGHDKPLKYWEVKDMYWLLRKGRKINWNYKEHLNAKEIRKRIGEGIWQNYLKIAIVRNPWDHVVSWYNWKTYRKSINCDFKGYVFSPYPTLWQFLSIDDLLAVDFVIRFEHLEEDLNLLKEEYRLPINGQLPKTKNNIRKKRDYTSMYDLETREAVRKKNLHLIDSFGYTF